jgi:cytochrome c556
MMRGGSRIVAGAAAALLLVAPLANAAGPDDAQAAFEHRVDTMKRMGHALYVTIGKVVRGKAELGPDTAQAAETIVTLSATIPTLFPAGSIVGDSRMKPEIFAAGPRVLELAAGVQQAAAALAAAAKAGDKTALAVAAKAQDDSCEACHRDFRKPEP